MAGVQAGISAGRLNIEIVAEIARVTQDMERIKRVINAASGDIAKSARAANDNLSGIGRNASGGVQQFARDVAALKAQLDPAWQAQQRFTQQQGLAMRAFKAGAIDRQQFIQHMRQINAELKGVQNPMAAVTKSAGAQKAGMQQLSYQLNDVATMYAMGAKPMQIFASQSGQIIQAVQLMTGGTSKLAAFLGGPWGIAITAGAMVLVPLIGKLFETKSAADSARISLDSMIAKYRQAAAERNRLTTGGEDLNKMVTQRDLLQGQLDTARRNAGSPNAFAYDSRIKKIAELNGKIAEGRRALDAERAAMYGLEQTAGDLIVKLGKVETATKGATGASRAHAGAMRSTAADADEFTTSVSDLINELIKYKMALGDAMQPVVDAINAAQVDELTAKLRKAQDEATRAGREAAEASQQWNADLRDTVDLLDQIGGRATGLGNVLAGLYGARTGDFSGVPGPTGALLANLFTTRDQNGKRVLNRLGDEFRSALDSVFGGNGKFFQALQGATTGAAIGGILGGNQASQFGAMAGGALGQVFGEKFLSKGLSSIAKGLGDFAGPLGSILGSVAGSLLGGLFKGGPDWATTNLASGATGGNKDQQKGAVGQAVGAFDQALQQIAGQLGATVGDFNTSIGLHNGNWHVSTAGRTGTLRTTRGWSDVTDFGPNAEAALTAAIQDAISDGAFLGLSDGVKRIISGGGDLDTQLKKAVSFQSVFSELEKLKDPVGAAVKALDSEMTYLRSVFGEAGASAAEYAQLEELYQLKRRDIIEKSNAEALELERTRRTMEIQLMELTGNTVGALAAARQMELDALDPSLRALAQQIHAAQDMRTEADAAARAIEEASRKFGDLAKNLRDYALSLTGSAANGPMGYRSAQVEFMKQSALATAGDQAGLAALQGASQAYLEVSRATSTAAQYQRDLGNVLASLDQAARVAESLASPGSATVTGMGTSGSLREVAVTITDGNASLKAEIVQLRSDLNAALLSIAQNTSSVDRTTKRWDRGNAVAVTADDPVPMVST
jgi:hypothetical protein